MKKPILLTLLALALPLKAATEIWVSPTSPGGTLAGTLKNPYDGSTQANLDAIITGAAANTIIHLLPGTFLITGGDDYGVTASFNIRQSGIRVLGSGIDVTTVRLGIVTNTAQTHKAYAFKGRTDAHDIEIADMTIDGNISNEDRCVNAAVFHGQRCAIRRIKAINMGTQIQGESFVIALSNGYHPNTGYSVAEQCEVSQYAGFDVANQAGQTVFNAEGCTIRSYNYLDLPRGEVYGVGFAFSSPYSDGNWVLGNVVKGGRRVYWSDTGDAFDTWVVNNFSKDTDCFFQTYKDYTQNWLSYDFWVCNNQTQGTVEAAAELYNTYWDNATTPQYKRVLITGNNFDVISGAQPLNIAHTAALLITDNRMTSTRTSFVGPLRDGPIYSPEFTMLDNLGITGEIYNNFLVATWTPSVGQQEHPQSLTRKSTAANVTLGYADHYVGVTSTPVTITLPSAAGRDGKEFIIVDEGGSATSGNPITISPASGQTINGASSKTMTAARSAITLISNGSNWFISRSI